jgi:hypothetical protein
MERREKCTKFWSEGKRPLVKPRHRWENGIRVDLTETGCECGFSWLRIGADGELL